MDQILPRTLTFDRFTLDLARGSLRSGDVQVKLRPKTFDVLCYLANNAGRVISKQELHDAVWERVAVSDDSLVQCVRQLRQSLDDDEHRLIKTVSKRGYLLDAVVTSEQPLASAVVDAAIAPAPVIVSAATSPPARSRLVWLAAICLLGGAAGLAVIAYPRWVPAHVAQWFSAPPLVLPETVIQRIATLSRKKELPVPEFQISPPRDDVPDLARRFIGVWVSDDEGWTGSGRQLMVIVTNADRNAVVQGYLVNGPAKARSWFAGPAFASPFTAQIVDRKLRYDGRFGMTHMLLTPEGRMHYRVAFENGGAGSVMLDPIWTLSADQAEARTQR